MTQTRHAVTFERLSPAQVGALRATDYQDVDVRYLDPVQVRAPGEPLHFTVAVGRDVRRNGVRRPVVVLERGGHRWLVDGHHRAVHARAERMVLPALVMVCDCPPGRSCGDMKDLAHACHALTQRDGWAWESLLVA